MNIAVCIKQIIDPEIPASKFKIDEKTMRVIPPEETLPVINPFDANAIELSLRLKEKTNALVTVFSIGTPESIKALKHAIAMGADGAFLIEETLPQPQDSIKTAQILSSALRKAGEFDLILCGKQSADWDEGLTGIYLAHLLDIPLITNIFDIEFLTEGKIRVKRSILDGHQIFETTLPALLTVSSEVGKPRIPKGKGIVKAASTKIPQWKLKDTISDISIDDKLSNLKPEFISLSQIKNERKCEILSGENIEETAEKLIKNLSGILNL